VPLKSEVANGFIVYQNFYERESIMSLHPLTFEYAKPTGEQVSDMTVLRNAAKVYAETVDNLVPDGPDKTYILRKIREIAMWVNVAVVRQPDGTPRA
jgi:hypothetical protein